MHATRFHRIHALMRGHCFGAAHAKLMSSPFALYEGESGGGGSGNSGGGDPPKTFTQAEVDAMVGGLKTKNAELLGLNKTLKTRADVIGERTPEEVAADLEFATKAREDAQRKAGEFDTLKLDMAKRHAGEIEKVKSETTRLQGKLFDILGKREAEKSIEAKGGSKPLLLPHIEKQIRVVEEDGEYVARVVDSKGNVRIGDGKGTPMSIEQLVEEFRANADYGPAFKPTDSSGSGSRGPNNQEKTGTGGEVVLSAADARDVGKYRAAKADAEAKKVPLRILTV